MLVPDLTSITDAVYSAQHGRYIENFNLLLKCHNKKKSNVFIRGDGGAIYRGEWDLFIE